MQKVQGAYVGSTVPAQGRRGKAQDNTKKKKKEQVYWKPGKVCHRDAVHQRKKRRNRYAPIPGRE